MAAVIESGLSPRGLEGLELIPERYRLPLLEYRGRPESAQDDVRQGDEFLPRKRPKSGNLGGAPGYLTIPPVDHGKYPIRTTNRDR